MINFDTKLRTTADFKRPYQKHDDYESLEP